MCEDLIHRSNITFGYFWKPFYSPKVGLADKKQLDCFLWNYRQELVLCGCGTFDSDYFM